MFSSKEQLKAKTGPEGIGRFSYLQSLVTEFQSTDSAESRRQVLANLANFAYDPINYAFFRKLNVIDLFLDALTEDVNSDMTEFAIGGLCNVCLDKVNKDYILQNDGVELATRCLSSSRVGTVLSAMTTLMYLATPSSIQAITAEPVVDVMTRFSQSTVSRLSNLAKVFLEDYCTPEQRQQHLPGATVDETQPC